MQSNNAKRFAFLPLSLLLALSRQLILMFAGLVTDGAAPPNHQFQGIRPLLVFELVINGRLNWYPFGMRCKHFHF